jgi:EAL domain-containing protein (putative c-di-GMP-specific phosphodiesterase class I)
MMERGNSLVDPAGPITDLEAVCQRVRTALEPARAHAISLHDENGEVLWMSESSMGPDEHNAVREALEMFANVSSPAVLAYDLGDARSAVSLRAVNSRRAMAGAVMVIMDSRILKHDAKGDVLLMTPKLQRAVAEFAETRPGVAPASVPTSALPSAPPAQPIAVSAPFELTLADSMRMPKPAFAAQVVEPVPPPDTPISLVVDSEVSPIPASPPHPAAPRPATPRPAVPRPAAPHAAAPRPSANPRPAVAAGNAAIGSKAAIPGTASAPSAPSSLPLVKPDIDRLHAALRRSPIALHVQRLVPLAKGSQMRRFEVLLRSKSEAAPNAAPQAMLKAAVENGLGSMIDRRVVTELIGWLVRHPDVWRTQAVMFSVNLTTTALLDEHFIKFVGLCLAKSSLSKGMIAFEIDVPTAVKMGNTIAEVAAALQRLDCPLVLDDFGLRTECFDLLRLPGVRYIKLAPEITAKMRSDKISQAAITAVVQMAHVLGMHTVAKRCETAAEHEWLTALGVDFIQSNSFSPSAAIDTLALAEKAAV